MQIAKCHNIYKTTNLVNGKFYWGVHNSIDENDGYLGSGAVLKKAIEKYGRDSFRRKTMVTYETADAAYFDEKLIVTQKYLDENPMCYNVLPGGSGGDTFTNNPNKEEIRQKYSIAAKKRFENKENHPWYGKGVNRGRVMPEEQKRKIGTANKGKKWSEEAKQNASKSHTGKVMSEEIKQKIANTLRGKFKSEETKEKMRIVKKELYKDKKNHPRGFLGKHHKSERNK